jgi:ankyrin repeat protein
MSLYSNLIFAAINNKDADVDIHDTLLNSIRAGYIDIVHIILEKYPEIVNLYNRSALFWAAISGHIEITEMILNMPPEYAPLANCDDSEALLWAVRGRNFEMVYMLLNWPGFPPRPDAQDGQVLVEAVLLNDVDIMRLLLSFIETDKVKHVRDGMLLNIALCVGCDEIAHMLTAM